MAGNKDSNASKKQVCMTLHGTLEAHSLINYSGMDIGWQILMQIASIADLTTSHLNLNEDPK